MGMRRGLASMAGDEGPEVVSLGTEWRKEHLLPRLERKGKWRRNEK